MAAPFSLTYLPDPLVLPYWLSYSTSATATTTATYSFTSMDVVLPTTLVITRYGTNIIQLPITVDADPAIPLAFPYTRAGGSGILIGSVLGGEMITIGASTPITLSPSPIPTPARITSANVVPSVTNQAPTGTSPLASSLSRAASTLFVSAIPSRASSSTLPRTTTAPLSIPPISTSSHSTASTAYSLVPLSSLQPVPSGTPYYSNHATLKSSLALVLGTVGGIVFAIGGLWLLERRRRRNARGGAGEDWSSIGSSHHRKNFWTRFFKKRGTDELYSPGLTADMEERNPLAGGGIYSKPRKYAGSREPEDNSILETSTLLDNDLADDNEPREPVDPLNHQHSKVESDEGDLSTTSGRIFASPVVSDSGAWFRGAQGTKSTNASSSGSGSGGTQEPSVDEHPLPKEVLFKAPRPRWNENRVLEDSFVPRKSQETSRGPLTSLEYGRSSSSTRSRSSSHEVGASPIRTGLHRSSTPSNYHLQDPPAAISRLSQTFSRSMSGLGLSSAEKRSIEDEERRYGRHLLLIQPETLPLVFSAPKPLDSPLLHPFDLETSPYADGLSRFSTGTLGNRIDYGSDYSSTSSLESPVIPIANLRPLTANSINSQRKKGNISSGSSGMGYHRSANSSDSKSGDRSIQFFARE